MKNWARERERTTVGGASPSVFPRTKRDENETDIQPPAQKETLENFIEWTADYDNFEKVDWAYYRSQKDWEKAFRNWNKLRADRISLLEKWLEEKE